MTDLSELTKKQLLALCEEHELDTDGNKSALLERLELHLADHESHEEEELVEEEVAEDPVEEELVEEELDPEPVAEAPLVNKESVRHQIEMAWVQANGGGHPPLHRWEDLCAQVAYGTTTVDDIKKLFKEEANTV